MNCLNLLLSPAAALYGTLSRARNFLYDHSLLPVKRCGLPVISVGNVTAGGNSKTPLCLFLAKALKAAGHTPVILSRGYGGKLAGPHLVTTADDATQVGDEPLMLTRFHNLTVVVARDRAAGAGFIEKNKPGSIIILDDGFQHRRLHRDLDIVCVDVSTREAVSRFVEGRLLPGGRFRENRDLALRRAQVVVLSARQPEETAPAISADLLQVLPAHLKVFNSHVKPAGVFRVNDGVELTARQVGAFCSIANPEGFIQTLAALKVQLDFTETFPDHYQIKAADIERLRRLSRGRPLVCTAKDAVKLSSAHMENVYVLRIDLQIDREKEFLALAVRCAAD